MKVPGTEAPLNVALASSWVPLRAVPYVIATGVVHAIVGIGAAPAPVSVVLCIADAAE